MVGWFMLTLVSMREAKWYSLSYHGGRHNGGKHIDTVVPEPNGGLRRDVCRVTIQDMMVSHT